MSKQNVTYKRVLKRILRPFFAIGVRIFHIRILGKHPFMNKYTRRIPVFSKIVYRVESWARMARTAEERNQDYAKWFKKHFPKPKELTAQQVEYKTWDQQPTISIIMPTYNTDHEHLRYCIDSVIKQSYENWQLCIADDKSSDDQVREIIKAYAEADKRIVYAFRDKNGHISEASNTALELANGQYIALLDHDDELWPNALFEVAKAIKQNPKADFLYSDEDKLDETGKKHVEPFFKPDWSPEYLRSINYITHFAVIKRSLVAKVGSFRKGYEGTQDWDLFLRVSRETDNIIHIPTVLYSWRKSAASTAQAPTSKNYAYVNQKKALLDDIKARGLQATLSWQVPFSTWKVNYQPRKNELISIIIPTKDQYDFIQQCLKSVHEKTTYQNYEIVIVDTGSTDKRVWQLYDEFVGIKQAVRVVKWEKPFNFAAVCDFGATYAKGGYLLFLNNDTEVISPTWLEDMLGFAEQEHIGAVGCKLYYPDGKLQHAGIILGVGGQKGTPGIAGHFFPGFLDIPPQDPAQPLYVNGTRNFTAVTAACVMVSKEKFESVDGFDPIFKIAFNDVDFCLKLYDKGLRNVYLPHVTLFHHESVSVGQPGSKQRDLEVFAKEIQLMLDKWGDLIRNDPYYHPEFRRDIASARLNV